MELRPPQYPLSRAEFRRALATGHGRAMLHVERFGAEEFRDEILEAATVCKVYDLQVNGPRAGWLTDLCLAAGVEREVIALAPSEDPDDRRQRAALLLELARRGVPGARDALHACFGRGPYSDFYAAEEIVELDGDAGVLFVAREIGRQLQADAELPVSSSEFWKYDESRSEGAAIALLATHSDSDAEVRAALDALRLEKEREQGQRDAPREPRKAVAEVIDAIRATSEWHTIVWAQGWAGRASREEQQRVLELLLTLEDPRPLEGALRCIGGVTLPLLHPRIFELTRHADEGVRYWAARVLSKHSLPAVHDLGRESLARGDLVVALELLTHSTLAVDARDILAAVATASDDDDQHGVCHGVLDILKHCPEVVHPCLALFVYERTPCMHCRERAIQWLFVHQALPEWVAEECSADASEDIRNLAARRSSA